MTAESSRRSGPSITSDGIIRCDLSGTVARVTGPNGGDRLERRKARTRAALIAAARDVIARDGSPSVSIQQITDAADVGFGSFYNHFSSKDELFEAAIAEAFEELGVWLDEVLAGISDPAEIFATAVRITARLADTHPQVARILQHTGLRLVTSDEGLAPRTLRDIAAAKAAGRFDVDDVERAMRCTAGSLIATLELVARRPPDDAAALADGLAFDLLRMFGLSKRDARRLTSRPLPETAAGTVLTRRAEPAGAAG